MDHHHSGNGQSTSGLNIPATSSTNNNSRLTTTSTTTNTTTTDPRQSIPTTNQSLVNGSVVNNNSTNKAPAQRIMLGSRGRTTPQRSIIQQTQPRNGSNALPMIQPIVTIPTTVESLLVTNTNNSLSSSPYHTNNPNNNNNQSNNTSNSSVSSSLGNLISPSSTIPNINGNNNNSSEWNNTTPTTNVSTLSPSRQRNNHGSLSFLLTSTPQHSNNNSMNDYNNNTSTIPSTTSLPTTTPTSSLVSSSAIPPPTVLGLLGPISINNNNNKNTIIGSGLVRNHSQTIPYPPVPPPTTTGHNNHNTMSNSITQSNGLVQPLTPKKQPIKSPRTTTSTNSKNTTNSSSLTTSLSHLTNSNTNYNGNIMNSIPHSNPTIDLSKDPIARIKLQSDVAKALESRAFVYHYQPEDDLSSDDDEEMNRLPTKRALRRSINGATSNTPSNFKNTQDENKKSTMNDIDTTPSTPPITDVGTPLGTEIDIDSSSSNDMKWIPGWQQLTKQPTHGILKRPKMLYTKPDLINGIIGKEDGLSSQDIAMLNGEVDQYGQLWVDCRPEDYFFPDASVVDITVYNSRLTNWLYLYDQQNNENHNNDDVFMKNCNTLHTGDSNLITPTVSLNYGHNNNNNDDFIGFRSINTTSNNFNNNNNTNNNNISTPSTSLSTPQTSTLQSPVSRLPPIISINHTTSSSSSSSISAQQQSPQKSSPFTNGQILLTPHRHDTPLVLPSINTPQLHITPKIITNQKGAISALKIHSFTSLKPQTGSMPIFHTSPSTLVAREMDQDDALGSFALPLSVLSSAVQNPQQAIHVLSKAAASQPFLRPNPAPTLTINSPQVKQWLLWNEIERRLKNVRINQITSYLFKLQHEFFHHENVIESSLFYPISISFDGIITIPDAITLNQHRHLNNSSNSSLVVSTTTTNTAIDNTINNDGNTSPVLGPSTTKFIPTTPRRTYPVQTPLSLLNTPSTSNNSSRYLATLTQHIHSPASTLRNKTSANRGIVVQRDFQAQFITFITKCYDELVQLERFYNLLVETKLEFEFYLAEFKKSPLIQSPYDHLLKPPQSPHSQLQSDIQLGLAPTMSIHSEKSNGITPPQVIGNLKSKTVTTTTKPSSNLTPTPSTMLDEESQAPTSKLEQIMVKVNAEVIIPDYSDPQKSHEDHLNQLMAISFDFQQLHTQTQTLQIRLTKVHSDLEAAQKERMENTLSRNGTMNDEDGVIEEFNINDGDGSKNSVPASPKKNLTIDPQVFSDIQTKQRMKNTPSKTRSLTSSSLKLTQPLGFGYHEDTNNNNNGKSPKKLLSTNTPLKNTSTTPIKANSLKSVKSSGNNGNIGNLITPTKPKDSLSSLLSSTTPTKMTASTSFNTSTIVPASPSTTTITTTAVSVLTQKFMRRVAIIKQKLSEDDTLIISDLKQVNLLTKSLITLHKYFPEVLGDFIDPREYLKKIEKSAKLALKHYKFTQLQQIERQPPTLQQQSTVITEKKAVTPTDDVLVPTNVTTPLTTIRTTPKKRGRPKKTPIVDGGDDGETYNPNDDKIKKGDDKKEDESNEEKIKKVANNNDFSGLYGKMSSLFEDISDTDDDNISSLVPHFAALINQQDNDNKNNGMDDITPQTSPFVQDLISPREFYDLSTQGKPSSHSTSILNPSNAKDKPKKRLRFLFADVIVEPAMIVSSSLVNSAQFSSKPSSKPHLSTPIRNASQTHTRSASEGQSLHHHGMTGNGTLGSIKLPKTPVGDKTTHSVNKSLKSINEDHDINEPNFDQVGDDNDNDDLFDTPPLSRSNSTAKQASQSPFHTVDDHNSHHHKKQRYHPHTPIHVPLTLRSTKLPPIQSSVQQDQLYNNNNNHQQGRMTRGRLQDASNNIPTISLNDPAVQLSSAKFYAQQGSLSPALLNRLGCPRPPRMKLDGRGFNLGSDSDNQSDSDDDDDDDDDFNIDITPIISPIKNNITQNTMNNNDNGDNISESESNDSNQGKRSRRNNTNIALGRAANGTPAPPLIDDQSSITSPTTTTTTTGLIKRRSTTAASTTMTPLRPPPHGGRLPSTLNDITTLQRAKYPQYDYGLDRGAELLGVENENFLLVDDHKAIMVEIPLIERSSTLICSRRSEFCGPSQKRGGVATTRTSGRNIMGGRNLTLNKSLMVQPPGLAHLGLNPNDHGSLTSDNPLLRQAEAEKLRNIENATHCHSSYQKLFKKIVLTKKKEFKNNIDTNTSTPLTVSPGLSIATTISTTSLQQQPADQLSKGYSNEQTLGTPQKTLPATSHSINKVAKQDPNQALNQPDNLLHTLLMGQQGQGKRGPTPKLTPMGQQHDGRVDQFALGDGTTTTTPITSSSSHRKLSLLNPTNTLLSTSLSSTSTQQQSNDISNNSDDNSTTGDDDSDDSDDSDNSEHDLSRSDTVKATDSLLNLGNSKPQSILSRLNSKRNEQIVPLVDENDSTVSQNSLEIGTLNWFGEMSSEYEDHSNQSSQQQQQQNPSQMPPSSLSRRYSSHNQSKQADNMDNYSTKPQQVQQLNTGTLSPQSTPPLKSSSSNFPSHSSPSSRLHLLDPSLSMTNNSSQSPNRNSILMPTTNHLVGSFISSQHDSSSYSSSSSQRLSQQDNNTNVSSTTKIIDNKSNIDVDAGFKNVTNTLRSRTNNNTIKPLINTNNAITKSLRRTTRASSMANLINPNNNNNDNNQNIQSVIHNHNNQQQQQTSRPQQQIIDIGTKMNAMDGHDSFNRISAINSRFQPLNHDHTHYHNTVTNHRNNDEAGSSTSDDSSMGIFTTHNNDHFTSKTITTPPTSNNNITTPKQQSRAQPTEQPSTPLRRSNRTSTTASSVALDLIAPTTPQSAQKRKRPSSTQSPLSSRQISPIIQPIVPTSSLTTILENDDGDDNKFNLDEKRQRQSSTGRSFVEDMALVTSMSNPSDIIDEQIVQLGTPMQPMQPQTSMITPQSTKKTNSRMK